MTHFENSVEAIIQEAMQRGEFENLSNRGKPIDLTGYFDTPEDLRVAYSVLKNASILPREAGLLKEIADLKKSLSASKDEMKSQSIRKQIEQKQIEFRLIMERNQFHRNKG